MCVGDKYCILGAMCEFFMEKNPDCLQKDIDNMGATFYKRIGADFGRYYGFPPPEVIDFFGLDNKIVSTLYKMNDSGKTFKEMKEWLSVSAKIQEPK